MPTLSQNNKYRQYRQTNIPTHWTLGPIWAEGRAWYNLTHCLYWRCTPLFFCTQMTPPLFTYIPPALCSHRSSPTEMKVFVFLYCICIYTWHIYFIYLFGFLRRFQHCAGHITMGSWKGRGNQYIQFVRVLYCKLSTNGKQLPAFPLEAMLGIEPWPQRWYAWRNISMYYRTTALYDPSDCTSTVQLSNYWHSPYLKDRGSRMTIYQHPRGSLTFHWW